MGHETRKAGGGGGKQWGKDSIPPAILAFLQKGGQGQKIFYFCDFASGMTPKINFVALFFMDNNTLCRELNIFANV